MAPAARKRRPAAAPAALLPYRQAEVAALVPHANNARTHSAEQVAQIARSIAEFGFINPVIVDADGGIIAGHGRVLAARTLGLVSIPVLEAAGLSDDQKRAYVLADNKLALNAGWDADLLRVELSALTGAGFDLGLTGFNAKEIRAVLDRTIGRTDPDDVPPAPAAPVTRLGDVWLLGQHRLSCGDATSAADVAALLAGATPHLMVTDPPYGVKYDPAWRKRAGMATNENKMGAVVNDDRADWTEAWRLFPGSVAYVWHAGRFTATVQASLEAVGFEIRAQIIWAKDRFALSRGHYHWQHEPCLYATRDGCHYYWQHEACWYSVRGETEWVGDRKQSTLWSIPAREDGGHGHGTQKPVECMRRPIENNSEPGHAVYDPFSGSGTTLIAAEQTGRICLAMEIDPGYVDVAVRRWMEFTGREATREQDGMAFPLREG